MADPPTIIDLSKDNQASHQALDTTLRKLIAINQDFAENLAHQAVGEIEVSETTDCSLMSTILTPSETMARPQGRAFRFTGHRRAINYPPLGKNQSRIQNAARSLGPLERSSYETTRTVVSANDRNSSGYKSIGPSPARSR